MSDSFKSELKTAMKDAMKAKEKNRLGTIRMIMAEIKRIEVDERIDVDDARALAILDKMLKQRRDSITQYEAANRNDLADIEKAEVSVIQDFLPKALSGDEIEKLIDDSIASAGATSIKDMGKVMALVKPQAQGRADMAKVGPLVKAKLA